MKVVLRFSLAVFAFFLAGCQESEDVLIAGAIRNDGSGWRLVQDRLHSPIGISHVTEDKHGIWIWYAEPASAVRTLVVSVDEAYASKYHLVCGASVGIDRSKIYCSRDSKPGFQPPAELKDPGGAIWIYGVMKK